ncbi:hypothetical protein [Xanthomonas phage XPV3]|uniref:Uncharacterized protein n=1 Tax=Xanthomonas phage XPV1 TaxID=2099860 RepID=A0A3S7HPL1_9CAUD|nr:hypothetical protein KEM12_gp36 [Xanthomonas phage XPV1]AVO24200.1 hypothetical protein [Xanthomonas phage XPV1]AVO24336.1 hypothetical protein [Xanthomonas phage XPV3]
MQADNHGSTDDQGFADAANAELETIRQRACADAAEHLMVFWPRAEFPRRGPDNVLRLGYGRAIERSAQPESVARMALNADIERVSRALESRVFVLMTRQPGCVSKVGYLYAVADIIGVERIRDWDELWTAAGRADWQTVCLYLMALQWEALDGTQVDKRMAAGNLIFGLRDA